MKTTLTRDQPSSSNGDKQIFLNPMLESLECEKVDLSQQGTVSPSDVFEISNPVYGSAVRAENDIQTVEGALYGNDRSSAVEMEQLPDASSNTNGLHR